MSPIPVEVSIKIKSGTMSFGTPRLVHILNFFFKYSIVLIMTWYSTFFFHKQKNNVYKVSLLFQDVWKKIKENV